MLHTGVSSLAKPGQPNVPTLKEYFEFTFGASYSFIHAKAVENFVKSLAAYSLVTYVLQVILILKFNLMIATVPFVN